MLWMRDVLNLLGAKRTEVDPHGRSTYLLPNGDTAIVKDERWWYLDQAGEGKDGLWNLAYPRLETWRREQERKHREKCDKSYRRVRSTLDRLAEHLRATEWDSKGIIELREIPNKFSAYPAIDIRDSIGTEVSVDFTDDGTIQAGSAGTTAFTGVPSMNKALKKWYDFPPRLHQDGKESNNGAD